MGKLQESQRLAYRFALTYLVVYNLPFPLQHVPIVGWKLYLAYRRLWSPLASWAAAGLFHIHSAGPLDWKPGPSDDTAFSYMLALGAAVVAALITLALSARPRNAARDERLEEAARTYVRFALAASLIVYGAMKVIPSQFPAPTLDVLLETYGASSPMRLLWTFMGASAPYEIFTGTVEMLAGLLLTSRRTALLGALLAAAAMANVAMLNLCYDVPVKLFSSHLLAMAVVLAAPDARRLYAFFVPPQAARPAAPVRALIAVLVALFAVSALRSSYRATVRDGEALKAELYGVWDVAELRPTGAGTGRRWRRLVFPNPNAIVVDYSDGATEAWKASADAARGVLEFTTFNPKKPVLLLDYRQPDPGSLVVSGEWGGHPLQATLRRAQHQFPLLDRGFHWVSEHPYNR